MWDGGDLVGQRLAALICTAAGRIGDATQAERGQAGVLVDRQVAHGARGEFGRIVDGSDINGHRVGITDLCGCVGERGDFCGSQCAVVDARVINHTLKEVAAALGGADMGVAISPAIGDTSDIVRGGNGDTIDIDRLRVGS